jgi:AcrR family transcriptional regulator
MPRAGLTPDRVVRAAAQLADDRGWEAVSLATVASGLGVRVPSLYKHVGGLEDLRRGVALVAARSLAAALREAAVGRSGDDALRALAGAYRTWARAHPGSYRALQRAPAPGDDELAAVAGEVVDVVVAVLRGYGLGEAAALHAVRAVRSVLHGFADLEAVGGFGLPVSLDESHERVVELLVGGVRALAVQHPAPRCDDGPRRERPGGRTAP